MHTQIVEAFLLIEQPRQRLGHWSQTLSALDGAGAPEMTGVVAYYDPSCDQALLDLQYDARAANLSYVAGVARLADVKMVLPAELSEGERVRFLAERLSRCSLRVVSQRTAIGALTELVRVIKEARTNRAVVQPPPAPAAGRARATTLRARPDNRMGPRGEAPDMMLVPAKGTRDNLQPFTEQTPTGPGRGAHPEPAARRGRHLVYRDRRTTTPMPNELSDQLTKQSSKLATLDALVPPANPPMRTRAHPASQPPELPRAERQPHIIFARYLRGGRWVPARVGALSLKTAVVLSGALPRLDDYVDLALLFGNHRAIVRGRVSKVSSMREAVSTGAAMFTVALELDIGSRGQLTALLLAAREAKITIKPPPPRATRRFPVEWHVALGTERGGRIDATAFDVSTNGMFVRPEVALERGSAVVFVVVLDDGGSQISGRARVVRQISDTQATACGLTAGYGLLITTMSESDRMRWLGFLARIERRADKRVLVGAEPARLVELQAGLESLGYAVTGGTDPGALVQLASAESRPADAVLIDDGWLQNEASATLVENVFHARNVPCVTMRGEPRRARQAIDQLLEVVV